ncbi:MAG: DUF2304 domain-containing protein [Candidatus Omnitrophica bacterium]|nr:DUF2304 domain-containing protein [Candidatus Omnitrophota bacterium]
MAKLITIGISCFLILSVVELIRKEKLTFKYASLWLTVSFLALVFAIFNSWLFKLSEVLGFVLPSNFIFFSLLIVLTLLIFVVTLFLCQQNRHNDTIAQKIALLEHELESLKKNKKR